MLGDLDGVLPQVDQGEGRGGCGTVEEVLSGVGLGPTLRAGIGGRYPDGVSVGEKPGALARSQLGEGGTMVSGEVDFGCRDVWGTLL